MIKKQKYLLAFFILIFSQQSLSCSDYFSHSLYGATYFVAGALFAGAIVHKCSAVYHEEKMKELTTLNVVYKWRIAHPLRNESDDLKGKNVWLEQENAQLKEQVTSMGVLVASQARDLSYVRRLNKVLLQMERAAIPAQSQNKNSKKLSDVLRKKKNVSFKEVLKGNHKGR